jgi:hypothetical protein
MSASSVSDLLAVRHLDRRVVGLKDVNQVPSSTPNGIRTRAAALKGRCPRPLDDGGGTLGV